MDNLFAVFDPSTSKYFSLNWVSLFTFILFFPSLFFYNMNRLSMFYKMILDYMLKDLQNNLNHYLHGNLFLFVSLFFSIITMNFLGLFPYIFTPTSHLIVTAGFCLPFWFSLMLKSLVLNTFYMFSHLVPTGSPFILAPFMVVIETISIIIRPITLSVRLAANMIAGHLLIVLLSNLMQKSLVLYFLSMLPIFVLFLLEMSVAIIQGYVFVVLLSLYLNEGEF